jgi:8-oxo-dGTP pyrophosphatase MutT (NUDIX family)
MSEMVQFETDGLPDWLAPLVDGSDTIRADDLSRFAPPSDGPTPREAAVLMLFGEGPGGPDILLTERAHSMRSHPGQISFPGGSLDPEDSGPIAAALREAQEETGLDPTGVQVFGALPELWLPPSNFAVTTVLGWWATESPVSVVDPNEVEAILRVPLSTLLEPEYRVTMVHPLGFKGPGFLLPDGPGGGGILWGFTAGLISRLFDHVGWTRPWDTDRTHPVEEWMIVGRGNEGRPIPAYPVPNTEFQEGPGR